MSAEVERASQISPEEREMAEWYKSVTLADEVIGYSLIGGKENEETLDNLIGVPFLIEGITFRRGDINIAAKGQPVIYRDYVSVEALVRPDYAKKFKRSRIVFNDGSTGIYRQVVKYLVSKELVTTTEDLPENGGSNETRYDVSYSQYDEISDSYSAPAFSVRLFCPEGLRKSPYTNEYGESQTWYLA